MYSVDVICNDTVAFYEDNDNFPFLTALVKDILKFYAEKNNIVYTNATVENGKIVFYNGKERVKEADITKVALFYLRKVYEKK